MPTVLKARGYRFFFFTANGGEPAHLHVEGHEGAAKIWLTPEPHLQFSHGYNRARKRELLEIARTNRDALLGAWRRQFGN